MFAVVFNAPRFDQSTDAYLGHSAVTEFETSELHHAVAFVEAQGNPEEWDDVFWTIRLRKNGETQYTAFNWWMPGGEITDGFTDESEPWEDVPF